MIDIKSNNANFFITLYLSMFLEHPIRAMIGRKTDLNFLIYSIVNQVRVLNTNFFLCMMKPVHRQKPR
jgi:hypothetical protein